MELFISKDINNMKKTIIKWIWQHKSYPNFSYDKSEVSELISQIEYHRGVLSGISQVFNKKDTKDLEIDILLNEAVNTSEIEGEYLQRDSVRASLYKKLNDQFNDLKDNSTHQTDALVDILIDCSKNRTPLTVERLHGWHNSLFITGYSGLNKIKVASFRDHDDMTVVSGSIGREKVHYVAPPHTLLEYDVKRLLQWLDTTDEDIYVKSAIGHLWFVSIHPYDDGNGRIARAIADYILSGDTQKETEFKLFSLSMAINKNKKEYYEILDKTTNLIINRTYDFTLWIKWHLEMVKEAMSSTQKQVEYIVQKTKFWDRHREDNLNERQIKVLNKILDKGSENFEGGLKTKKYQAMTKTSAPTAARDIKELLEKGCIEHIEGTKGRNTSYRIKLT